MRILKLFIKVFCLCFLIQCSAKTETKNQKISTDDLSSDSVQSTNFSDMSYTEKKIDVENWIETSSKDFHLQNLKAKPLSDDEKEIRIWSEQAHGTILNCLIIYNKNNKWQANLYFIRVVGESGEYEKTSKGNNLVNKKVLSAPKSGWENVNDYLMQKGIKIPLSFSWDTNRTLVVEDEGSVTLEIKQGDNYDLISYGELSESNDGKSIVNICNDLENEFLVKIGCKN